MQEQTRATVTQASPLKVRVDGTTTAVPAKALNSTVYAVNDRVSVIVRNPRVPLVLGKES